MPTAEDTGLPPTEEKNDPSAEKASAISRRVTTNPIGWPLPAALAMVITSGTTPCSSKPQNASPVRPYPICTSSEITSPPASRTTS